jgi:hypothetical protein
MENSADGWSSLMSVKVAGPVLREQVRRLFFHSPRCAAKVIGNQPKYEGEGRSAYRHI